MPRASERRSPAAQRHADTVRFVLFEARHHRRTRLPALIWTRADGYKFCSDPTKLQAYEVAVIREKLTAIRRFITGVVAPHAVLQPKGRWIKHLNTQLNSVESTLDVIADYSDA